MCGSHDVNVAATPVLKFQHGGGQLLNGHDTAGGLVTYIPVLTKEASQVAMGEKDGPGTSAADKGTLFPEMWSRGCYFQFGSCLAESLFPFQPVHPAFPWAEPAIAQNIPENPTTFC
jgi:hypothetical protein